MVQETERNVLAHGWWHALSTVCRMPVPPHETLRLLASLVGEMVAGLHADPFDASVAADAGAALVAAGVLGSEVPVASAKVLYRLGAQHPECGYRLSALLAAFGQGYGAELHRQFFLERQSVEQAREEARRAADDRFRVVFDNAAVAIAIVDTDFTLLDANRGLTDMLGVPVDELRGTSVYDFAHPDDRDYIRTLVYGELVPNGKGTVKLEQRLVRADGSYGWAAFAITFVKGVGRQDDYLLAVGEDVTEQHRLRDELHRQARHDLLTGLPNRRHLLERVEAMIATADIDDRVGLCFIDIDGFKAVNDRYGHGTGDRVLAAVASRLQESVLDFRCPVARIGGDEFVAVIPPPADHSGVTAVATSLQSALVAPFSIGALRLRMSASIGAVLMAVVGTQAEALLDAADSALYRAKADGKDRWVLHTLESQAAPSSVAGG
ncbi:sensor domain-containing diguanylate cyclase [Nocardia suismassiliense]|uniref:sensor domain-containing diguanylate cyclase n=1 Tax=Nocardia suismassiliense TaxID=2077092 RepID=UPI001F45E9C9|nr:sensor domain-containing diguanylate cyclase [Nocardia suismassiliense]